MDKIFYVYAHKKKDTGEIFYIGKGKEKRDQSKSGRSNHWRNTANKHGLEIIRLYECLSESDAYILEIETIKLFRSNGIKIINIANGGEGGLSGIKLTESHKLKLRKAKIGKKQMPDHALKSAKAKLGKKQPRSAVEYVVGLKKKKVINSDGEIFESATEAAKKHGTTQSNISMCCRGERLTTKGKAWSYDTGSTPAALTTSNKKKVRNTTTGEIFESVDEASSKYSVSHQGVSLAAREGSKCKSCYWEYL